MPFELSMSDAPSQRRAKIVATLGPASNTEPVFRSLVRAGLRQLRPGSEPAEVGVARVPPHQHHLADDA